MRIESHITAPTLESIFKRYEERQHDYCYWSHEEVTVLIEAIKAQRMTEPAAAPPSDKEIERLVGGGTANSTVTAP